VEIDIRPETLVRWHRAGFRRYWRCKSRNLGGRPQISADLRALIRRMSVENVLWGAPRIHGELLKLGFAVAQSTVAQYTARKAIRPAEWLAALRCLFGTSELLLGPNDLVDAFVNSAGQ
jgi:hypothetical protein